MEYELPNLIERNISIDLGGLMTHSKEQSETEQIGYSIAVNGDPLYGFDEGDWQEGWYVIGRETMCGDPLFIDLNDVGIPVYTSAHGMGDWNETCIAESYDDFEVVLNLIDSIVLNRKIPSNKAKGLINSIEDIVGEDNIGFWKLLVDSESWQ